MVIKRNWINAVRQKAIVPDISFLEGKMKGKFGGREKEGETEMHLAGSLHRNHFVLNRSRSFAECVPNNINNLPDNVILLYLLGKADQCGIVNGMHGLDNGHRCKCPT
jgi:hypothetical protein